MPLQYADDPENDWIVGPNNARIRRCQAARRDGQRCGKTALAHQVICAFHGGKAPTSLDAAARRQKEEEVADFVGTMWVENPPTIENVHAAMHLTMERHHHLTEQIGRRLNAEACECCGISGAIDGPTFRALTNAVRESFRMFAEAERLNLLDRSLQIEEQKSTMVLYAIFAAIEAVLPNLGEAQMYAVRSAFLSRLEALEKNPPSADIKSLTWHGKAI